MGGTDHGGAVGETSTYSTGTSAGAAVGMLCAVVLSEGGLLANAYVDATVGAMVSLCLSGSSAGDSAAAGTSSPLPSAMGRAHLARHALPHAGGAALPNNVMPRAAAAEFPR